MNRLTFYAFELFLILSLSHVPHWTNFKMIFVSFIRLKICIKNIGHVKSNMNVQTTPNYYVVPYIVQHYVAHVITVRECNHIKLRIISYIVLSERVWEQFGKVLILVRELMLLLIHRNNIIGREPATKDHDINLDTFNIHFHTFMIRPVGTKIYLKHRSCLLKIKEPFVKSSINFIPVSVKRNRRTNIINPSMVYF